MSTVDSKPFVDHAQSAVHGLRRSLAELLAGVGADPDQPQEISRRFGLDKTLTWRISRVVREEDAWEAVQHIPRRPSFRILLAALSAKGAGAELITEVWRALDEFERFVEVHSGDRETLEIMTSVGARKTAGKRLEAFRKTGFLAASALWGVRASAHVAVHLLYPKPGSEDMLIGAVVCGLVGFRRLRADVPWTIATLSTWDRPGAETNRGSVRPIDASIQSGAPLLTDFCSRPLPGMISVPEGPTRTRFMIAPGPVGNTASADVMIGWMYEGVTSRYQSTPGECGEHGLNLTTPAELAVQELWIHRSLPFAFNIEHAVYSRLPGGPTFPEHKEHVHPLPVFGEVNDVGCPPDMTVSEVPFYGDMMRWTTGRLGFELSDFRAFRCRLAFPPIPTISVMRHPLLPRV